MKHKEIQIMDNLTLCTRIPSHIKHCQPKWLHPDIAILEDQENYKKNEYVYK